MTGRANRKGRTLRNQAASRSDPNEMLDILLALDRRVVELSMRLYNIPRRDRSVMRAQSRRLHDAVRKICLVPKAYLQHGAWKIRRTGRAM